MEKAAYLILQPPSKGENDNAVMVSYLQSDKSILGVEEASQLTWMSYVAAFDAGSFPTGYENLESHCTTPSFSFFS